MSVLIKDMKIPKSCLDCPLYDAEESFCKAQSEFLNLITSNRDRAISCPLVALPDKHGRLIDFDALIEKYLDGNSKTIAAWELKDIKAVIEAEDGL